MPTGNVVPGGPALRPSYTPAVGPSGAGDFHVGNQQNLFTPTVSFSIVDAGQAMAFYKGMPRVVSARLYQRLLSYGSGAAASATDTLGGTFAANDVVGITLNGNATSYTVLSADASDASHATLATHLAAAFNANAANAGFVATAAGAVVTVAAQNGNTANNAVSFAVSKTSTAGTTTASGLTLSGGTQGTYGY